MKPPASTTSIAAALVFIPDDATAVAVGHPETADPWVHLPAAAQAWQTLRTKTKAEAPSDDRGAELVALLRAADSRYQQLDPSDQGRFALADTSFVLLCRENRDRLFTTMYCRVSGMPEVNERPDPSLLRDPDITTLTEIGRWETVTEALPPTRAEISAALRLSGGVPWGLYGAGSVFCLVGLVFGAVAAFAQLGDPLMTNVFAALGGVCVAVATPIFVLGLRRLFTASPWNRYVLDWIGNFLGGLLGACSFCVPATAVLPVFLLLAKRSPNYNDTDLWLGLGFSTLGVLVSVAVFFVARAQWRYRPPWLE